MELRYLQLKIEDYINYTEESSIFFETNKLIKQLINKDEETALLYFHKMLPSNIYDSTFLNFGVFTLETIIIYVLGVAFSGIKEILMVKVATIIDLLDNTIRTQAFILNKKELDSEMKKDKLLGKTLLEYMLKKDLVQIENLSSDTLKVPETGKGYVKSQSYIICNFDLSHLPSMHFLPMVCPPEDWDLPFMNHSPDSVPKLLSDIQGGYLGHGALGMYNRFVGFISTKNPINFNIELHENKWMEMRSILNRLQKEEFRINTKMLEFIRRNRPTLEKMGLLMPSILLHSNTIEAFNLMRTLYLKNDEIRKSTSLDALLLELSVKMQKARNEAR